MISTVLSLELLKRGTVVTTNVGRVVKTRDKNKRRLTLLLRIYRSVKLINSVDFQSYKDFVSQQRSLMLSKVLIAR